MTPQEMVKEFHKSFGAPVSNDLTANIPKSRYVLRHDLITEELEEYDEAYEDRDIVEIADALGDMLYVIYGAAVEHGIDMQPILEEIHDSNMSKLGEDGQPILGENGKILKGPNYFKPDIGAVLLRQIEKEH